MSLSFRLAVLACVVVLAGCGAQSQEPKGPQKAADAKAAGKDKGAPGGAAPAAVPATVLDVAPQRLPVLLEAVGQLEGSKEVEVRARVAGTIERRLYNEGDFVKAGAPLFQIDAAPFQIALEQARAQLAQERARNEQARRESSRLKDLVAQKAISQREYDDATSSLKLSEASVQAAQARVRDAELNLSYTKVNAPVSGVTGRAARSEGSLVTASDSLLTTISQVTPIWARFALAEAELSRLPGGRVPADAQVALVFGDGSRYPARGRINFVGTQVDPRIGTRQMRAEFPNANRELLPGQFVRVQVSVQRRDPIVLVPQSAVLQGEKGHFVFVLDGESKAAVRPITVGEWAGKDWIVLSGLKPGDRVVTDNLLKMQPGAPVQPLKPQAPAAPAGSAPSQEPAKK